MFSPALQTCCAPTRRQLHQPQHSTRSGQQQPCQPQGTDNSKNGAYKRAGNATAQTSAQDELTVDFSGKKSWVCRYMLTCESQNLEAEAGPKNPGAVKVLIDLQITCENVQVIILWSGRIYFTFPVLLLRMQCMYFLHTKEGSLRRQCGSARTDTTILLEAKSLWYFCGW